MDHFELVSQYNPTGDKPQAIKELVEGFKEGNHILVIYRVTQPIDTRYTCNNDHISSLHQ